MILCVEEIIIIIDVTDTEEAAFKNTVDLILLFLLSTEFHQLLENHLLEITTLLTLRSINKTVEFLNQPHPDCLTF